MKRAVERIGTAPGLDDRTRSDLVAATHLLGSYHFAPAALAAMIPEEVLMQSPAYQAMERRVRTASYQKVARAALTNRLGTIPTSIQAALDAAEPEVLEQVTLVLTSRDDDATMLARVRATLGLAGE